MGSGDPIVKIDMDAVLREVYQLAYRMKVKFTDHKWKRTLYEALAPTQAAYKQTAEAHRDTGTLAAAVNKKFIDYDRAVVAIVGPRFAKNPQPGAANPNHAWLTEFGSHGPRKPGADSSRQDLRKPNILVYDRVNNGRSIMNSEKFQEIEDKSKTFVMGNKRRGFFMRLDPGQTYGAMPAGGWMAKAAEATQGQVASILKVAIERIINKSTEK